jgi:hypothetical protein
VSSSRKGMLAWGGARLGNKVWRRDRDVQTKVSRKEYERLSTFPLLGPLSPLQGRDILRFLLLQGP